MHVAHNGAALLQDTAWRRALKEGETTTVGALVGPTQMRVLNAPSS